MNIASRSIKKKTKCCTTKQCSVSNCDCDKALIETSEGNILIELNPKESPNTVKNFIEYVKSGQYENTIFHRIISNFMIQGGEFFPDGGSRKPTKDPIKSEANNGLQNKRGTVAMARTNNPDSAKAQFFINVRDNNFLNFSKNNAGYTVFAKVTKGMDVVDKIRKSKTNNKNWPNSPVLIKKITLE